MTKLRMIINIKVLDWLERLYGNNPKINYILRGTLVINCCRLEVDEGLTSKD